MLIGLGEDMTSIGFGFTRLKVKVTRVSCKKHAFHSLSREISQSLYIFLIAI